MKIIIQVTKKEYAENNVQFRTTGFAQQTLRKAADKFDELQKGNNPTAVWDTDVRLEIKD